MNNYKQRVAKIQSDLSEMIRDYLIENGSKGINVSNESTVNTAIDIGDIIRAYIYNYCEPVKEGQPMNVVINIDITDAMAQIIQSAMNMAIKENREADNQ